METMNDVKRPNCWARVAQPLPDQHGTQKPGPVKWVPAYKAVGGLASLVAAGKCRYWNNRPPADEILQPDEGRAVEPQAPTVEVPQPGTSPTLAEPTARRGPGRPRKDA